MTNPVRVTSMTFNDGSVVDTGDADVIVLVGPNNVGKSRTLQEIHQSLALHPEMLRDPNSFAVLNGIDLDAGTTAENAADWLGDNRSQWTEPSNGHVRFRTTSVGEMNFTDINHWWHPEMGRLGELTGHFVKTLWCGERLGYVGSPGRLDPHAHPEHPIHWLVRTLSSRSRSRRHFARRSTRM